ncbi:MAG: hypothetical protein ACK4L4_14855 [Gemmobacter sp.]
MMLRLAAFAVSILGALPALAGDCPASRADAEAGIEVTMDEGSIVYLTRAPDGIVTEDWIYADGFRLRIRAVHGVHATEITELDQNGNPVPGTDEITTFDAPLPPEPELGDEWSTQARMRYGPDDGGEIVYASIARAAGELVIGPCRYASVTVTARITDGGEARLEEVDFLPALGVAILRATGGGLGEDLSVFAPVTIGPMAP